jgi:hypothetical protein
VESSEEEELMQIASQVVKYTKINQIRPRIMVITNSEKSVVVGIGRKEGDTEVFTVKVRPVQ